MKKLEMKTIDGVQENLSKIERLFPTVITESMDEKGNIVKAVDFEILKRELSTVVSTGKETYEFRWVGKDNAIVKANTKTDKALRPCKEESKNWDKTENLYIEGDNLDVLKILKNSYKNQVKMIYIDPPYNTGKDTFVYPDDYSQNKDEYDEETGAVDENRYHLFKNLKTNGRFHSSWCSMMYPCLKVARDLLTEDGVIFISIDDHEVENLRKICDEIFGEANFISQIIWFYEGVNDNQEKIKKTHEYILCYQVSEKFETNYKAHDVNVELDEIIENSVVKNGEKNPPSTIILPKGFPCEVECIHINKEKINCIKYLDNLDVENFKLEHDTRVNSGWSSKNILTNYIAGNFQAVYDNNNQKTTFIIKKSGNIFYKKQREQSHIISVLRNYGTTMGAAEELKKDGIVGFSYPKPVGLLKFLEKIGSDETSLILDFFSGSATTAHAVMQLNAEDDGNRKFIMVQLPEICKEETEAYKAGYKNICEIGKERIRRAGEKIVKETGKTGLDIGFRVYKLDSGNYEQVFKAPGDLKQSDLENAIETIKRDRTDEDLLFGTLLAWGADTCLSMSYDVVLVGKYKIYVVKKGAVPELVACFDEDVNDDVIRKMAEYKPMRVAFRERSLKTVERRANAENLLKQLHPMLEENDIRLI